MAAGPDDMAVMPYTSGTTGQPKGCVHTHRSVMSTLVGGVNWFMRTQDAVFLSVLPFFHVTGMAGSMNGPIYLGATIVVLPRWDREAAATLIERHRVSVWQVDLDHDDRLPVEPAAAANTTSRAWSAFVAVARPCPRRSSPSSSR